MRHSLKLLTLAALLATAGCEHWFPVEPVVLPPCKMIPMVDQKTGQVFGYYVSPEHYVGTYLNCDLKHKVYP